MTDQLQVNLARSIAQEIQKNKWTENVWVDEWDDNGNFNIFVDIAKLQYVTNFDYPKAKVMPHANFSMRSLTNAIRRTIKIKSATLQFIETPKRQYESHHYANREKRFVGYDGNSIKVSLYVPPVN